jgi:hypothetical protein
MYTDPPDGATVVCADELGPAVPRTLPSAPGWSANGHRIKSPLDYAFRHHALAGQCFADPDEIAYATRLATG